MREDSIPASVGKTIWDELPQATVDTQKLEHLFESRAKDMMTKVLNVCNNTAKINCECNILFSFLSIALFSMSFRNKITSIIFFIFI